MGILRDNGIAAVHHYTPIHYLPFIARSGLLKGKPSLQRDGFARSHLRSMSHKQDIERGFGVYGFLTIDQQPRILSAKLGAGFPHIGILVPSSAIEGQDFALCRYNVAMTRFLKRATNLDSQRVPRTVATTVPSKYQSLSMMKTRHQCSQHLRTRIP